MSSPHTLRECSGSTLGIPERCQQSVPVKSSELTLVLDAFSAGSEDMVIYNVRRTYMRSRNACNVKVGTYPVHLRRRGPGLYSCIGATAVEVLSIRSRDPQT